MALRRFEAVFRNHDWQSKLRLRKKISVNHSLEMGRTEVAEMSASIFSIDENRIENLYLSTIRHWPKN